MTPENFKKISERVVNDLVMPLSKKLTETKKEVAELESRLQRHQSYKRCCDYLTNGETSEGFLGVVPTYTMFVSKYSAKPPNEKGCMNKLNEANLVIIPDILDPHYLRVNIPTSKPGEFTNTSRIISVPGIIARMLEYSKNATNIVIGTFADVLREPCSNCGEEALVVGQDRDDGNDDSVHRYFIVSQLCVHCSSTTGIAVSYDVSSHVHIDQTGFKRCINCIYRHR